jgi:hypothetical protein
VKKSILGVLVLFAMVGCTYTANINGEIKSDSNFAKLPQEVEKFNTCLTKQTPDSCKTFLAEEDKVITGMQAVVDILPELPQYLSKFGAITWDAPIGSTSEVEDENLYIITGSSTMDGEKVYVKYDFVQQSGVLKLYGVFLSKTPLVASFAQ